MIDHPDIMHVHTVIAVDRQAAQKPRHSCHRVVVSLLLVLAVPVCDTELLLDRPLFLSVLIQNRDICDRISVQLDKSVCILRAILHKQDKEIGHITVKSLFGVRVGPGIICTDDQIYVRIICIFKFLIAQCQCCRSGEV